MFSYRMIVVGTFAIGFFVLVFFLLGGYGNLFKVNFLHVVRKSDSTNSKQVNRVYFQLTTVPSRAYRIKKVLDNMMHQTLVPNGIILTLG